MKFMKSIVFFLFIICCSSYANEDKYVLIGQNGNETAFVLELEDNLGDNIQVTENGEVYLKVDRVFAVRKGITLHGGRVTQGPQQWHCPYCGYWWDFGKECENDKCATNRWKKEKKEKVEEKKREEESKKEKKS
ncbi:MAG: hypothetical protein L0207_02665 [Chlamydiae bacterium]|nr:hypothetical protein [Chlamydiota bacterium]